MRALCFLMFVAAGLSSLAGLNIAGEPARPAPGWTFACAPDNDLYRALAAGGALCPRFGTAAEAVGAAAANFPAGGAIRTDDADQESESFGYFPSRQNSVESAQFEANS
jgi:hypothetical protein